MKYLKRAILASLILPAGLYAADSEDGLWQSHQSGANRAARVSKEAWIQPDNATRFLLDAPALKSRLTKVPLEFSAAAHKAVDDIITIPMPDGSYQRFRLKESPVMHPDLAAKFPEIKTYTGQGLDDETASARIDFTPLGFHAQILSPRGAVYVDPYYKNDTTEYSSYYKKNYRNAAKKFSCGVKNAATPITARAQRPAGFTVGDTLRTYRLAVACTGEYASFYGGTVSGAMAGIVTTINRVTGIFETEVAVRLELVANNNLVVYTNAGSDPFNNNNENVLIDQVGTALNSEIGSANYDIGHVVSTGGGGLAGLGVVCSSLKHEGVTGSPNPQGDPFDVDFVAHEIGHQFGADHTFNGDSGSCAGGNRTGAAAFEPGSGNTIMSYAGICGDDNIKNQVDPYFHHESIRQILTFVDNESCEAGTTTGNTAPLVDAGGDYIIPAETPFELTAVGSDVDGDTLTYSWEQRDLGPQQDLNGGDNGSSPLFRFLIPNTNPVRTLPRLFNLLNGTTLKGETMPTTNRDLNFRVTARDNRAGGGATACDDMHITVIDTGSPFEVTAPNTGVSLSGPATVTWNVAGTTASPISASTVDILLSTDGGNNFDTTLLLGAANTGSAAVTLPNITTSAARIKVRGSDNIFFDVSDTEFSISPFAGMSVSPTDIVNSEGDPGGPFSPACQQYTITNNSGASLNWDASSLESWLDLSPSSGTLANAASVNIDVCLNSNANSLGIADYSATITFSDLTAVESQDRIFNLEVGDVPEPSTVCTNIMIDGSFESGTPWADWTQSSTEYGTPLCDASCGSDTYFGPRTGVNFIDMYNPSVGVLEEAAVSRAFAFPEGAEIFFSYYMWIGLVNSPYTDTLRVRVDGAVIQTYTEPSIVDPGYIFYTHDLSAYADGNSHTIEFYFRGAGSGGLSDTSIDDLELLVCYPDSDGDGLADKDDTDDDGDGIEDVWEDANGLDTNLYADAFSDNDTDGYNALAEYKFDTDPNDINSFFSFILTPVGELEFNSSSARSYGIETNNNLNTEIWSSWINNIPGTGALIQQLPVDGDLNYRIRVDAP